MKTLCLSVSLLIASASFIVGQPSIDSPQLIGTIALMDTKLFDAFNAHDASKVMSFFTEDVEFYHDKDGVSDYHQTAESFKTLFVNVPDIHRELVPATLKVYPIKDYGAIQVGIHRFTHKENGKEEAGSFSFLHIWRKDGDSWKISRVVSYGH